MRSSSFVAHLSSLIPKDRAIMIRVASIGYGLRPEFVLKAPGQPGMRERIEYAIRRGRAEAKAKL